MKALTLWQPWATAARLRLKKHETRSWPTSHRGLLALHAGLHVDAQKAAEAALRYGVHPGVHVRGAVLGVVDVVSCERITDDDPRWFDRDDEWWGDYAAGRYAFDLKEVLWFEDPVPARGRQGLWEWTPPPLVEHSLRVVVEARRLGVLA